MDVIRLDLPGDEPLSLSKLLLVMPPMAAFAVWLRFLPPRERSIAIHFREACVWQARLRCSCGRSHAFSDN